VSLLTLVRDASLPIVNMKNVSGPVVDLGVYSKVKRIE
jgi:hypothetical protein